MRDLGFEGYRFTWSNKRSEQDSIEERLDRALANDPWRRIWKEVSATTLPRHKFDHNPILLEFCKHVQRKRSRRRKHKLYRFEKVWLNDFEGYEEITKGLWVRGDNVVVNIARTSMNLEEWGTKMFGHIAKTINELGLKQKNLQQRQ